MSRQASVVIQWHDEPNADYSVLVSIDDAWNGIDEDDDIFFYFANEQEYEQAKNKDNEFEFWIVEEN